MNAHHLEDESPRVFGRYGEKYAWPTRRQSVHALAPYIVADDRNAFAWQSEMVGDYYSSAWYQLQMTINAGQRQVVGVQHQDWPYQFRHILQLSAHTGQEHPLRYVFKHNQGLSNA